MISWLDLFGIAVFAASGALAAAQRKQTLVTFSFFALVTGAGGGTVRDLLIGAPVFWVQDWRFAATCLVTAGLVWVTPQHLWKPRALDWFDAVGIAIYAVFGTWKSLTLGVPLLPAMMMGVITACVGGIIRDVLAGEPSILLKPEIYVTAAALASGLFGLALFVGIPVLPAAIFSATAGFALRAMAIWKGWAIPAYRG
ncbi:MAG: trimeric intracellular cation channel family protein [Sphingorhabdus sp.]|uniref:trimeric intracellular cation channel family protein n=1 Tax=Sphingorhabdus sp. TaxID=1902408 RepID=UPI00273EBB4D|nr:trimeric intracellular cation channel family protein [Sphingorhabdus sp.]MDP4757033.1 trimeric intracellular cation channel family protein [Sphingorhabdus sp.]MDP4925941.1 trimeric intracellular cation channel family protein [Sphingorhabdus sp.]